MNKKFTFVDLFAGIGGFRIALERCGGKCKGFSEIDDKATWTYKNYFVKNDNDEWELGDITKINNLPEKVDMLVGGVPCQSWSVAGKMRGFDDPRGKLWEDAIRLVELNKPKVFIFENVKGLADPRNKKNLDLIISKLEATGYIIPKPQTLNSYDFGLPQNRTRIFIVGFRNDQKLKCDFKFPKPINKTVKLYDFIENIEKRDVKKVKFNKDELSNGKIPLFRNFFQKEDELNDFFVFCDTRNGHSSIHSWDIYETSKTEKNICMAILKNRRKKIYGPKDGNPLSFENIKKLVPNIKEKELNDLIDKKILKKTKEGKYDLINSKNLSGIDNIYRVYMPNSNIFSTLTATGVKDYVSTIIVTGNTPDEYKKNFIEKVYKKGKFRQITTREAGLLQGFPKDFTLHPNERFAYKQFGNAVSVDVVENLTKEIIKTGIFN